VIAAGAPGAITLDRSHPRDVLTAVRQGSWTVSTTHTSACRPGAESTAIDEVLRTQVGVVDDSGAAVDVQTDELVSEVHQQEPHLRVLLDVSQARHDAVAPVLRIREVGVVQHLHEAWQSSPQ
jgi:hypothetical protein